MQLFFMIVFMWICFSIVGLFAGNRQRKRKNNDSGSIPVIGSVLKRDPKRQMATYKKRRLLKNMPLKNTIPEPGTFSDWIKRSGMMGTQTSLSALEDRENDWLAREIRLEETCDNEFISEMRRLKLEHKKMHNKLHGNN